MPFEYIVTILIALTPIFYAVIQAALDAKKEIKEIKIDLLIITPVRFSQEVLPLVAHKKQSGITSEIVTLEQIYASYSGRDEAEQVKNCLFAYWRDHSIRYAMLVGDCDVFPVRFTNTDRGDQAAHNVAYYSTDLYFACLTKADGSFDDWDHNQNGFFGELQGETHAGKINVDDVSIKPTIAIGRVPASTEAEIATFVSKVISYEQSAGWWTTFLETPTWHKRVLLIATSDYDRNACLVQNVVASMFSIRYDIDKLYSSETSETCGITEELCTDNIVKKLNDGVVFASYIGHGSLSGWSFFSIDDIRELTNQTMLPIIFASACNTTEFATNPPYSGYTDIDGNDHLGTNNGETFASTPPRPACIQATNNQESFGEELTVKNASGAVAYVGAITGSQQSSFELNRYFFKGISREERTILLGDVWVYMINEYYENVNIPEVLAKPDWGQVANFHQPWKYFLFGDPSLRIKRPRLGLRVIKFVFVIYDWFTPPWIKRYIEQRGKAHS